MKLLSIALILLVAGCDSKSTVAPDCVASGTPDGRACVKIYSPVCGCDSKTYGNSCEAESFGITRYTAGECGK